MSAKPAAEIKQTSLKLAKNKNRSEVMKLVLFKFFTKLSLIIGIAAILLGTACVTMRPGEPPPGVFYGPGAYPPVEETEETLENNRAYYANLVPQLQAALEKKSLSDKERALLEYRKKQAESFARLYERAENYLSAAKTKEEKKALMRLISVMVDMEKSILSISPPLQEKETSTQKSLPAEFSEVLIPEMRKAAEDGKKELFFDLIGKWEKDRKWQELPDDVLVSYSLFLGENKETSKAELVAEEYFTRTATPSQYARLSLAYNHWLVQDQNNVGADIAAKRLQDELSLANKIAATAPPPLPDSKADVKKKLEDVEKAFADRSLPLGEIKNLADYLATNISDSELKARAQKLADNCKQASEKYFSEAKTSVEKLIQDGEKELALAKLREAFSLLGPDPEKEKELEDLKEKVFASSPPSAQQPENKFDEVKQSVHQLLVAGEKEKAYALAKETYEKQKSEEAYNLVVKTADMVVTDRREQAASIVRDAKKLDLKEKKEKFIEAVNILKNLKRDFPETSLASKLDQNIASLESQISKM